MYLHATEGGVICVNLSPSYFGRPSLRGWLRPEQILTLGPYQLSVRPAENARAPGNSLPDLETKGSATAPFPVVAAAVILPARLHGSWLAQVRDSKELSPAKREVLNRHIRETAISFGVGAVSHRFIDTRGIVRASKLA